MRYAVLTLLSTAFYGGGGGAWAIGLKSMLLLNGKVYGYEI